MRTKTLVIVALLVLTVRTTHGATIHVDIANCPGPGDGSLGNPYCSIQTAIDNAVDTDEIVLGNMANVVLQDCLFSGNVTTLDGGGAMFIGIGSQSSVLVERCTFVDNSGPQGGAVRVIACMAPSWRSHRGSP